MSHTATHPKSTMRTTHENTNEYVRLAIHGARGRMGQRIVALANNHDRCRVIFEVDRQDAPRVRPGEVDVVVDFSSVEGAVAAMELARSAGAALLVGTTGLPPATREAIEREGAQRAVMIAPNTSLGVAVARRLVREAARLLEGFDVDIVETHHTRKLDAPSGTAKFLAEAVERGSGRALPAERVHSLRAGDVVGDHVVTFCGPGERLEIGHFATSRDLFALGALRMAAWLARQPAGVHTPDEWFEHHMQERA